MTSNLHRAIIEFLANEFHLEPDAVGEDLNFDSDLHLSPQQLTDLLQRLQDALDFTLPEDAAAHITTVDELLAAVDADVDLDSDTSEDSE